MTIKVYVGNIDCLENNDGIIRDIGYGKPFQQVLEELIEFVTRFDDVGIATNSDVAVFILSLFDLYNDSPDELVSVLKKFVDEDNLYEAISKRYEFYYVLGSCAIRRITGSDAFYVAEAIAMLNNDIMKFITEKLARKL